MAITDVEVRAKQSRGISSDAILTMVYRALERREITGECLVDVGCGEGSFLGYVRSRFVRYVGIDAVRYEYLPDEAEFFRLDLDAVGLPLPEGSADVVIAVEVIEHLENPRDFMRKL